MSNFIYLCFIVMNRKISTSKRYGILSVLLLYLAVTLSNIFLLAPSNAVAKHGQTVIKHKIENFQARNLLERTDKATLKESLKNTVAAAPLTYLRFVAAAQEATSPNLKVFLLKNRSFTQHRYSYLSFCTFRV